MFANYFSKGRGRLLSARWRNFRSPRSRSHWFMEPIIWSADCKNLFRAGGIVFRQHVFEFRLRFPGRNRRDTIFVRHERASFHQLIFVNVSRAIAEGFANFDAHDELGFGKIFLQWIVARDRCIAVNAQSPAFHEIDEEQADRGIFHGVSS